MSDARYAIYYAPAPDSALWTFGSQAIGYDAATGHDVRQQAPPGLDADTWHGLTAEPRRYGFHATMKAPFRLASDTTLERMRDAFVMFCQGRRRLPLDALVVADLDGFIALVPDGDAGAIADLAMAAVLAFEPFRAPLTEAERARRLLAPLTPRQIEHLDHYGYPYVDDEFRFHMTLTGRLADDRRSHVRDALAESFAGAVGPVMIDRLALFEQTGSDEPFRIIAAAPLA